MDCVYTHKMCIIAQSNQEDVGFFYKGPESFKAPWQNLFRFLLLSQSSQPASSQRLDDPLQQYYKHPTVVSLSTPLEFPQAAYRTNQDLGGTGRTEKILPHLQEDQMYIAECQRNGSTLHAASWLGHSYLSLTVTEVILGNFEDLYTGDSRPLFYGMDGLPAEQTKYGRMF